MKNLKSELARTSIEPGRVYREGGSKMYNFCGQIWSRMLSSASSCWQDTSLPLPHCQSRYLDSKLSGVSFYEAVIQWLLESLRLQSRYQKVHVLENYDEL